MRRLGTRMRSFGKLERRLGVLELAVVPQRRRFGQDGLHHIPLLQNARLGLHDAARRERQLGLGSGRVQCAEHGVWRGAGGDKTLCIRA